MSDELEETQDFYDPTWRTQALCTGMNTSDFFPEGQSKRASSLLKSSCEVCKECPVAVSCLYEAFVNEYDGIWGGTTYKERQAYVRYLKREGKEIITRENCVDLIVVNTNK